MGLTLVRTEFTIKNRRIDTLAFDSEARAFVIIEYKRDRSHSVIDQGFTYLSLMLANKADFLIEYQEALGQPLRRNGVEWSQSRVMFVAPSFTENQKQATDFNDIAIELWQVRRFEGGLISVEPIKNSVAAPSVKPLVPRDDGLRAVVEEIRVFVEEDHLTGKSEVIVELYEAYKSAILRLDDNIEVKPKKVTVGFAYQGKVFADVAVLHGVLKCWINLKRGELDDARGLARDVSSVGHWGSGDYELRLKDDGPLEYVMSLVKQALIASRSR
ncbi:MAG: DUF5655 domain-containing protein [Catalinimonas sp.]